MKNIVQKVRKESGLTQKILAEKSGISRPYLSEIERERAEPSGNVIFSISKALNQSVESIFFV